MDQINSEFFLLVMQSISQKFFKTQITDVTQQKKPDYYFAMIKKIFVNIF